LFCQGAPLPKRLSDARFFAQSGKAATVFGIELEDMRTLLLTIVSTVLFAACQTSKPGPPPTDSRAGRPFNAQTHRFEDPQQPNHPTSPGDATQ
jgi:hypothetical protein